MIPDYEHLLKKGYRYLAVGSPFLPPGSVQSGI